MKIFETVYDLHRTEYHVPSCSRCPCVAFKTVEVHIAVMSWQSCTMYSKQKLNLCTDCRRSPWTLDVQRFAVSVKWHLHHCIAPPSTATQLSALISLLYLNSHTNNDCSVGGIKDVSRPWSTALDDQPLSAVRSCCSNIFHMWESSSLEQN
jgi:hypothetical protein